mmetsp:Transcript_70/g.169  ORF Transcript_70/g.169 Transcript_70/m.169 type:complete len:189 (+) Transcript_70:1995-2561(+)
MDSRRSWVIRIPVNGSSALTRCMICHRSSRVKASSAPKGSSSIRTSGAWISARQSEARCFMPPESSEGRLFSNPSRPTSARSLRARSSPSVLVSWVGTISRGSSTFCRIVRHSSKTGFWNAIPTFDRGAVMGVPCTRTSPSSGIKRPATRRVRVDLPQPDGPTTATKPPSGTVTSSPSRTGRGPEAVR